MDTEPPRTPAVTPRSLHGRTTDPMLHPYPNNRRPPRGRGRSIRLVALVAAVLFVSGAAAAAVYWWPQSERAAMVFLTAVPAVGMIITLIIGATGRGIDGPRSDEVDR